MLTSENKRPADNLDSQNHYHAYDHTLEATQLSQSRYSQTQGTQASTFANSQVEPRRKYWAVFIPLSESVDLLKVPWPRNYIQIGRAARSVARNDIVLSEKRISNVHCRITLGFQAENGGNERPPWRDHDSEPEVWIEDRKSSNGTFVNGERVKSRRLLSHGDEISLGHAAAIASHDVRWIYRSVGRKGARLGDALSEGGLVPMVFDRYQVTQTLGKGSFAEVKRAIEVETGAVRAIKQIAKHRFAGNKKTLELFHREIDICGRLNHENVCRLLEWFEDPQHIHLVLEFVDGGDLLDHIMAYPGPGLPEAESARFTYQICSAMAYTHSLGVTHRDLKPENILVMKATPDYPSSLKIADFGLAKMVHAGTMLTSMVGTPQYLAPEVVMQTTANPGYENKVDSWAIGIIVYSMMTKALPFDEDAEMAVDARIRQRFTQPFDVSLLHQQHISEQGITFIRHLLAKLPEARSSMAEALEHEWLAGPSSQPGESQIDRLGGDSMYSVESFSDDESEGVWTRPVTASGTNFGGDSVRSDSHESFSQPMGNLRLVTPAKTGEVKRKSSREVDDSSSLTSLPSDAEAEAGQTRPRKSTRLR